MYLFTKDTDSATANQSFCVYYMLGLLSYTACCSVSIPTLVNYQRETEKIVSPVESKISEGLDVPYTTVEDSFEKRAFEALSSNVSVNHGVRWGVHLSIEIKREIRPRHI